MKCNKCNIAERHGSLAYCLPCNAVYMKAYREAKKAKAETPVAIEPVPIEATPSTPYKEPKKVDALPSLVYWSYYVTPGTPFHKEMLEAEKQYQVS